MSNTAPSVGWVLSLGTNHWVPRHCSSLKVIPGRTDQHGSFFHNLSVRHVGDVVEPNEASWIKTNGIGQIGYFFGVSWVVEKTISISNTSAATSFDRWQFEMLTFRTLWLAGSAGVEWLQLAPTGRFLGCHLNMSTTKRIVSVVVSDSFLVPVKRWSRGFIRKGN